MIRRLRPWVALAAAFAVLGSCGREPTGLGTSRGGLVLAPRFANSLVSAVLDLGAVRVVLTRPVTETPVLDTTIAFPAATDSLTIELRVPIEATSETFTLRMAITNTQGDTVFRIGPTDVIATTNPLIPPTVLPEPTYVGVGADAVGVRFVTPPTFAAFSQQVPLVAEAYDDVGDPIPGTPIGFALVTPADTTRARFADRGVGSLTTLTTRGAVAVRAYLLTGQSVSHSITIQPVANQIVIQSGGGQTATVGTAIAAPVVARVRAADNLGVEGIPVFFRLVHGIDTLSVQWDTTDATGDAQFTPTLGTMAGAYSVVAGAAGVGAVIAPLTALPGPASRLEFTTQPTDVLPLVAISPAVVVTARDAFGNAASSFVGGVTMAMLDNPQAAVLGGTTVRTAVGGVATFNDLTLDGTGAGLTMRATATGLASDTSATFAILAGTPTRLEILQQPTNRLATEAFTPAITVAVRDAGGNTVATATDVVTIAILDGPGGSVLAGTASVAAVSGIATFPGLSIAKAGVGYTLRVTSGSLVSDTTVAFNVAVGPPTQLGFYTQPPAALVINDQMNVQVAAYDAGMNLAISYGGTIMVAIANNPGGATLGGTTSVDAEGGIAVFGDLTLNALGSGYTLQATAEGVLDATSNAFDVTPPANVVMWINGSGGSWETPSNWSTGTVPTAADTAWIKAPGTYTVTIASTLSLGRVEIGGVSGTQTLLLTSGTTILTDSLLINATGALQVGGGTLSGSGVAVAEGPVTWSAGNLQSGGGRLRANGPLLITGVVARTFSDFELEIGGTATWDGTAAIGSGSGAVLRVLGGGTLDIRSSGGLFFDQGGTQTLVDLQGIITRTVSTDTVRIPGLVGSGAVGVSSGVFEIRNASTFGGSITIGAGAEALFTFGTHTLTGGSIVQGPGTVAIGSGTVSSTGGWAVTGTTRVSGGAFDFDGVSGQTNDFELVGGTKAGSGLFQVTGQMTWTSGNICGGDGITRVQAGGLFVVDGTDARTLSAHQVEVGGTGLWAAGVRNIGSGSAGIIRVLAGATFDLQGGGGWFFDQGGAQSMFEVLGTVTRTVGTDTIRVPGLAVSLGGLVLAQSGILEARNSATSGGTFSTSGTGEVLFRFGTQTMTATANVTGSGLVSVGQSATVSSVGGWAMTGTTRVNGGTLDYDGSGNTGTLDIVSGTKGGSGSLTATSSFQWTGGNLQGGSGTTAVGPSATGAIGGTAARTISAHTLDIGGAVTWPGSFTMGSGSAGTIRVLPTGSLDIQGDPGWFFDQGGAQSALVVQGTLLRTTSAGLAIVPGLSADGGSVTVMTGILEARNAGTSSGILAADVGAELRFTNGVQTMTAPAMVQGNGLVHMVSNGTVSSLGGWNVTGTTRIGANGQLDYDGASGTSAVFEVLGGTKAGSGLFQASALMTWTDGNLNGGNGVTRVMAGGTLVIDGNGNDRTLSTHTLEVGGAGSWPGTFTLSSGSGGLIRVLPTGTLDIQGDVTWLFDQGGAQSAFEVQGSATRSTSSGTAVVPGLSVSGILSVNSGILEARNTGSSSGTISTSTPGEMRFASGNHTLTGTSVVTGTGTVSFTAGTTTAAGGWSITGTTRVIGGSFLYDGASGTTAVLDLLGGVKGGNGLLTATTTMSWSDGDLSTGTGATRVGAAATLTISGAVGRTLNTHSLEVLGTANWGGTGTISSGTNSEILVAPGGVLNSANTPQFQYDQGGGTTILRNQGTINVSGPGTTTIGARFEDSGVVTVAANATLNLVGGGVLGGTSMSTAALGSVRVGSGTFTMGPTLNQSGSGFMLLDGGTLSGLTTGDTARFTNLNATAGNLRPGAGGVVQAQLFLWGGAATLDGGGQTYIPVGASASFTGTPGRTLNDHEIVVDGAAFWLEDFTLNSGSGAAIRVRPAGVLTIQPPPGTSPSYEYNQGGGSSILDIQGTMLLTSAATWTLTAVLQHAGTTSLTQGTWNANGGGTLGGDVFLDTPAALNFGGGGTTVLAHGLVVSGLGQAALLSGTLGGGIATDTAEVARLLLSGGTVDPAGTYLVTDHLEWGGNTSINGGTLVAVDSMEFTGTAARTLNAATIEGQGATTWASDFVINSGSVARLRNAATGTFVWSGNGDYLSNQGGGQSRLENEGSLTFSGTGAAAISAFVVDTTSDAIAVLAGTVDLSGGARIGASVQVSGSILQISGGTFSMQEGTALSGSGLVRLTAGTLTVDTLLTSGASIGDFELAGGQLLHEGRIDISNAMTWTGGEIESNTVGTGGRTRISDGSSLTISGAAGKNLLGAHVLELESGASADFGGSGNINSGSGAIIENDGDFVMSGTGSVLYNQGGAAPRFRNLSGAVLERNGVSPGVVMNFPIENDGGSLVAIGDTLRLTGGAVTAFTGNATATSAPLKLLGNFALTGAFSVLGADGTLVLAAGTLTVGPSALSTNGDLVITGSGVLNTSSAGSDVDVGGNALFNSTNASIMTAGRLTLRGGLTQGPGGSTTAFAPSGTHLTSFDGTERQPVSFANPGTAASRFNVVDMGLPSDPRRVELLSDVFAASWRDTTTATSDSLITASNALLTTANAQFSSTVFAGTRLTVTGATGGHTFSVVRFDQMLATATQFSIDLNTGVVQVVSNAVFATTPSTGLFVRFNQATVGGPATLNFTDPTTPGSIGSFFARLLQGSPSTTPTLIWNGTPVP